MKNFLLFLLFLFSTQLVGASDLVTTFDSFWEEASKTIYPKEKEKLFFTEAKRIELRKKAEVSKNIDELALYLNKFLDELKISHTHFYTNSEQGFYFLKSLFSYKNPEEPKFYHLGLETELNEKNEYVVRSVLDGYPAQKTGLKRGDIILEINSIKYHPIWSLNPGSIKNYSLLFKRGKTAHHIRLKPVFESIHKSFSSAISNSAKIIKIKNKKIGYVHLWTGTSDISISALKDSVFKKLKGADGIILDLRDGFGGAWWDHLEPFYPNRETFFTGTWVNREGEKDEWKPEPKVHDQFFNGPMVVIINEGVRSGKEALAYQFKKTKRAILIGTNTAGFFVAGKGIFLDKPLNYLLYLSSAGLLLDGIDIEGKGIAPDINVEYSASNIYFRDPQLEESLKYLSNQLK